MLAREFVPVPDHLYRDRQSYHLEVAPEFYNAIVTKCEKTGLHPVIAHSHPMQGDAWYSKSDDFGEGNLLPVLQSLLPERSVASLVLTRDSATGRRIINNNFQSMKEIRVVGLPSLAIEMAKTRKWGVEDLSYHDRQVRAFGENGQRLLQRLRVGIVGVGGTGSIVAEQIARLGVGEIILVDHDEIEASNISRVFGALPGDVGRPKVEVLKKYLSKIGGGVVTGINDSALKQSVLSLLRDCDVVFGCVDNDRTRALLNRFAHQYLIPVIDVGIRLDGRSGRITAAGGRVSLVGTGFTCLRCSHHLNPARILAESMPADERTRLAKEGYVMGIADPAPAVVSLNTVVAGLAVTAFCNLFVNLTGGTQPTNQLYDATTGSVFPVSPVHEGGCDVCDERRGVKSLGDLQVVSAY